MQRHLYQTRRRAYVTHDRGTSWVVASWGCGRGPHRRGVRSPRGTGAAEETEQVLSQSSIFGAKSKNRVSGIQ